MSEHISSGTSDFHPNYLAIAWRGRIVILIGALSSAIVFLGISFLMPPIYQGVTTMIPAPSHDGMTLLSQLGANLADLGIRGSNSSDYSPMYSEILRSRRILDQVLDKIYASGPTSKAARLIDVIEPQGEGMKRRERAYRKMRSLVDAVLDNRTGVLTLRVRAPKPEIAAGVANTLDSLLQNFTISSLTTQAGQNRHFIEGRLAETSLALAKAEDMLRNFREQNIRIGNSPRLLLEEGRLSRSLREQEDVYLTLRRQHELAKIEEYRDVPVISILDPAVVPAFRYSPKRSTAAFLGLVLGGLFSFAYLVLRER